MKITRAFVAFVKEEDGLTTVEYAIAGSLVGAAVIAAFTDLGAAVCAVIDYITGAVSSNSAIGFAATDDCT